MALVLLLVWAGVAGRMAAPSPVGSGLSVSASIPPWNNWTCNPNNPSPAALDVPAANPTRSEEAGSNLTVSYEFKVEGYVHADYGKTIYLPSVKAVLPTAPTGNLSLPLLAKTVRIATGNWSSPHLLSSSEKIGSNVTFSTAKAYLSSSKQAVMANATSGTLTLEFRWHWSFVPAGGGATRAGPWTIPSMNASSPYLPSIFYPAPYIGVLSTSPTPAPSGSQFNLTLDGFVANTSFRMVLEYPNNGTEIQSIWENTSRGAQKSTVWVPLAYRSGTPVLPASYLIHVHDVCEAIVVILPITVVADGPGVSPAPSAPLSLAKVDSF